MANYASYKLLQPRVILIVLLVAAVFTRVGARLIFGEEYFWVNSYFVYYELAENLILGKGLCLETTCAFLPPLYPLFLTISVLAGKNWLLIIVPQALLGAGTALCAFLIGRQLFNATTGLLACAITAFYPYYVMHDTALQETGMITFLTALSVWLLMRTSKMDRNSDWFIAGLALGMIVLTRASAASIVGVALLWTAVWGARGSAWKRSQKVSILLLATIVMLGPWLIETYRNTGRPVLNSQTGWALWVGNNPETFSFYPDRSIDRSADEASLKLAPADQAELDRLSNDEIATSDWFAHRALEYISASPWRFLKAAARKIEAGFSWRLNPVWEPLAQAAYAIGYVPVALLGIVGMFRAWRKREVILVALLFISFVVVTAVFWSHTSHRSYLDVYWIIFAASVLEGALRLIMPASCKQLGWANI
jgi:4-amino-4-deoxy-L-arabinose transferase-like glycosyltransferase